MREMGRWSGALAVVIVALWLGGGPQAARAEEAGDAAPASSEPDDEFDELDYDEGAEEQDDGDPFETVNRGIFWFNDGLDRYAIEPISKAWDYVLPDVVQRSLRRVFDNLRFPIVFVNDLFQGKPGAAGQDLARFVVNSTVGIAGFLDPAGTIGLTKHNEDFGQTLGRWGVPPGPYLMLPLLGPSGVRDGFGSFVDSGGVGFFAPLWVSAAITGVRATDALNQRSLIGEEIEAERRAALDWYAAVRSAYRQYRESLVRDEHGAAEQDVGFRRYYPGFQTDE